jgi:hypothetical protein
MIGGLMETKFIIYHKIRKEYYSANRHWGGINRALRIHEIDFVPYKKTLVKDEVMFKIEENGKLTAIQ